MTGLIALPSFYVFFENGQILLIQLMMILPIGQSLISQLLLPSAKANIYRNKDIKFDVVIENY